MGNRSTKIQDPKANVINEIEIDQKQVNTERMEICLVIITIFTVLTFALRVYAIHNKNLKKRYMSRANNLDRA